MSLDPVIRDLAGAIRQSPVASSPGMSILLNRALSRSSEVLLHSSSDAKEFFRALGKEIIRLRGTAFAESRLDCLYAVCEGLYFQAEAKHALVFGRAGVELARESRRTSHLRKFKTLLGILLAEAGDRGLSLQSYMESLELAKELSDGFGQFVAWNNISALLVDSGLYEEAIACARQALQSIDQFGLQDRDLVRRASNNISLALYRLGDFETALVSAQKSIEGLSEPSNAVQASSRLLREEHLTLALIALGQFGNARDHVEYMNQLVRRFPSPRLSIIASTMKGLLEVMEGDVARGICTLESSVKDSETLQAPFLSDALSALATAYEAAGDFEQALEATHRLVRHLEGIHIDKFLANVEALDLSWKARRRRRGANGAELKRSAAELQVKVLQRELSRSRQEMLERLAVAADIREDISGEHGYRVGLLSALLAKEIGWERDACSALDIAARLHDIGKFGIPEKILLDERTLKEAEKHFIASHTTVGAEILSRSAIPQVRIAEEIALCHHEWWDGSGYPRQLKATAIPKSARLVALADSFDAMTHGRPYAKAISIEAALDQIAGLRGRQFDPELTDHFLALVRRLAAEHADLDAYLGKAARNSPFLRARARIKEMLAQGRDSMALPPAEPSPGSRLN